MVRKDRPRRNEEEEIPVDSGEWANTFISFIIYQFLRLHFGARTLSQHMVTQNPRGRFWSFKEKKKYFKIKQIFFLNLKILIQIIYNFFFKFFMLKQTINYFF